MASNDFYHYPFVHGNHGITTNGTSITNNSVTLTNNSVTWQSIDNNSWQDSNLHIRGTAIFGSDIIIKGKSLNATLDKIEERLAILHPNPALEDKWSELKELGDKYRALEAEIIEKQKMWNILNK
jgi:hypothetical protein